MAPIGRRMTDLAQRSKGRQALRFQLELIPYYLDEIPANIKQASFMWERGAKLQYTEPSPVNSAEHTVYWGNTLLKQTATMYKEDDVFVSKEYLFKVQSITPGSEKRNTFAKTKIDLAKFCSCDTSEAREVFIPLKPAGTLRISIQATWLRHSSPENDTMTEISAMSFGRSRTSSVEDQDLSGFDHGAAAAAAAATAATATTAATVRGRQRQSLASPFQSKSTPTVSQEGGPLRRGASSLPPASPKTSGFGRRKANFQDVDLHDDEAHSQLPPKPSRPAPQPPRSLSAQPQLQQPHRSGPANLDHVSLPVSAGSLPTQITAPTPYPASPPRGLGLPPDDYDKILNESYATLLTSDSDDDEGGVVASAKRWWKAGNKKEGQYQGSNLRPRGTSAAAAAAATLPMANSTELEVLNKEDINSLRQLCKQALRERNQEQMLRQQEERRARHLQSDCEALAMSKSMLVERLREAEDRLMTMRQEETMNALVQAKIKLAQADYANLELQGHLSSERERVRTLKLRLTDLEAAYHATLDSLDRLKLPDAPGTPDHPFASWRR